jgi:uncharacterized Zn-finger protein
MDKANFKISIPTDVDGYVELQCPFCRDTFRIDSGDILSNDLFSVYCPYCGLTDQFDNFATDEIKEVAQQAIINHANQLINESLKKLEKSSKGVFKINSKLASKPIKNLYIKNHDVKLLTLSCCDRHLKVSLNSVNDEVYCPFCGNK